MTVPYEKQLLAILQAIELCGNFILTPELFPI